MLRKRAESAFSIFLIDRCLSNVHVLCILVSHHLEAQGNHRHQTLFALFTFLVDVRDDVDGDRPLFPTYFG